MNIQKQEVRAKENRTNIPKTICYTWVSDVPLPEKYNVYLDTWKKIMPDYKIVHLSKSNVYKSPFVEKAMAIKNYLLVGHYSRCKYLYDHGGVYFDIDIEVVRRFDELLSSKFIVGLEDKWVVNSAVIVSEKGHPFLKKCLDYMDSFDFSKPEPELETGPRMFTNIAKQYGWKVGEYGYIKGKSDILVLPPQYFYPFHYTEKYNSDCVTEHTFAVHHWAHSWADKVSIIIPCYNHAQYLKDAISSALSQTYKNFEVIVVNDGSTDNTSEVAKMFPVRLIEQKNKGLSAARNSGIKTAKGKWIVTLDADDIIHPTFLEKTVGKADIVSTYLREFGQSNRMWKSPSLIPELKLFLRHNQIHCCSVFRKEVWEKCGGYDENMKIGFEDWEFWIRAAKKQFKFRVIPEVLFNYRKRGHSMVSEAIKRKKEIYDYMKAKHPDFSPVN